MKNLLCLGVIASGLFTSGGLAEELKVVYAVEQQIREVSSMEMSMEYADMTVLVNGQELPTEAVDQIREMMPMPESGSRNSVTVAEFLTTEGDSLTSARVHYEEMEKEDTTSEGEVQTESALVGRTLLLKLVDGEVVATVDDEGDDLDEGYLQNHHLRSANNRLLPEGEVSVGDSWTLSDEDATFALGLAKGPSFFKDDDEDDEDSEDSFIAAMREAADKEFEVTFDSYREHEGSRCAVLTFTAKIVAELEDAAALFGDQEQELDGSVAIDVAAEGEMLFDLESHQPFSLEVAHEGSLIMDLEMTQEVQGTEFMLEMTIELVLNSESQSTYTIL